MKLVLFFVGCLILPFAQAQLAPQTIYAYRFQACQNWVLDTSSVFPGYVCSMMPVEVVVADARSTQSAVKSLEDRVKILEAQLLKLQAKSQIQDPELN